MASLSVPAHSTIGRSAKVVTSAHGHAVVHLTYDGTQPPVQLLEALTQDGWRNATPSPPPASAIDWSRPDLDAGRSYSLLPYPAVTSATYEGNLDQRDDAVARARALLDACGFLAEPGGAPASPPVARPAPTSATATPAPAPATATASAPTPATKPRAGVRRIEVVVAEGHAVPVRSRLRSAGTIIDEAPDAVFTEVTFRGNRSEVMTSVVRLVVEVEAWRMNDLVAQLTAHRVLEINDRR